MSRYSVGVFFLANRLLYVLRLRWLGVVCSLGIARIICGFYVVRVVKYLVVIGFA